MKTPISIVNGRCLSLMALLFFTLNLNISAQNACPNPDFPGCQAPGGEVFKVLLVLDESGSIDDDPNTPPLIRETVQRFADTLHANSSATSQFKMGIAEFSSTARVGVAMKDVSNTAFLKEVNEYLANEYLPGGRTNFKLALDTVKTIPDVDIVFFISDGNPFPNNNDWQEIANSIKCEGTYIFGVALGDDISEDNIQQLSGPDELGNPKSLIDGADWLREDIDGLATSLVTLAQSLVDTKAPEMACQTDITVNNDPGACTARVSFMTTAADICTVDPEVVSVPSSGSEFPIGVTTVQSVATGSGIFVS